MSETLPLATEEGAILYLPQGAVARAQYIDKLAQTDPSDDAKLTVVVGGVAYNTTWGALKAANLDAVPEVALAAIAGVVDGRILRSGDIMDGPLAVVEPVADSHAARKQDVDLATTRKPSGVGAVPRPALVRLSELGVSITDFGAQPIAADDTLDNQWEKMALNDAAIIRAFAAADCIDIPRATFRFGEGFDVPARNTLRGQGGAVLAPFPQTGDDKQFMRPGYKHSLPGSNLLFTGSSTMAGGVTGRTDRFNSFRYGVRAKGENGPVRISGLSIIQDMDVYDAAGAFTNPSPAQDNRADFPVALWWDSVGAGVLEHVNLFGYFATGGLIISGPDPDHSKFLFNSFMGNYGVAIVGDGVHGLSGSEFLGCRFHANDSINRSLTPEQWGTAAIYIDGKVGANNVINGHKFIGGVVRSYTDNPIQLGDCDNVDFLDVVHEYPERAGSTLATVSRITAKPGGTKRVRLLNNRFSGQDCLFGPDKIIGQADGPVIVFPEPGYQQGLLMTRSGRAVRIAVGGNGDGGIQISGEAAGSNFGWTFRDDADTLDSAGNPLLLVQYGRSDGSRNTVMQLSDADGVVMPLAQQFMAGKLTARRFRHQKCPDIQYTSSGILDLTTTSSTPDGTGGFLPNSGVWAWFVVDIQGSVVGTPATAEIITINHPTAAEGDEVRISQAFSEHGLTIRGDAAAGGNIRGAMPLMQLGSGFAYITLRYYGGLWLVVEYGQNRGISALTAPAGTTADRPIGAAGMIRGNTSTGYPEAYSPGLAGWVPIGGPAPMLGIEIGPAIAMAAGVISVTRSLHFVRTSVVGTVGVPVSENLTTINGGYDGALLTIKTGNSNETVVLKNATGNLRIGADIILNNIRDNVTLIRITTGGVTAWEVYGGFFNHA